MCDGCAWKRRYIYDLCIYVAYTTANWDVSWVDCTLLYYDTREFVLTIYIIASVLLHEVSLSVTLVSPIHPYTH